MSTNLLQLDLFDSTSTHVDVNPLYIELHATRETLSRVRKSAFAKIDKLNKELEDVKQRLHDIELQQSVSRALQHNSLRLAAHIST